MDWGYRATSIMELLPRDLIVIVYRYIADYNYTQLKRQYAAVWLNTDPNRDEYQIYWDHSRSDFEIGCFFIANWRFDVGCLAPGHRVRNFYQRDLGEHRSDHLLPKLPSNY